MSTKIASRTIIGENYVFRFGKYKDKNKTVADLIVEDPTYLIWVNKEVPFIEVPPDILARCYDQKPMLRFKFSLAEIRANITLLEGQKYNKAELYSLDLLKYLEQQFSRYSEIRLTLVE